MSISEEYLEVFEPFKRLVEIDILGEKRMVPENNNLLRCFQYLNMESISMGEFCWNGDCANCQVWLAGGEREKPALACRTKVEEGMKILRMSKDIELFTEDSLS